LISVLTIFNVKAQGPPRQREQIILKNKRFVPVFLIAAVRDYLQPISFLNRLETKLCNIAFPFVIGLRPLKIGRLSPCCNRC